MTDTMASTPDDEQISESSDVAETPAAPAVESPEMAMPSKEEPAADVAVEKEKPSDSKTDEIPTMPDQKEPKGIKGEIKEIADDFVIPISESAIEEWGKKLKGSVEPFKKYAEQVACGLYPTLAAQIQMGIPTRILLDPYIQVAQQVLGPVMNEPNWSDPKWSKALQGGIDDKTGRPVPMILDDWKNFLMQEPGHGWEFSPMAHERVAAFGKALHSAFMGQNPSADQATMAMGVNNE